MKLFKYILFCICLQINLNASAENVPTAIQDSLQALYHSVHTIGWSTDQGYYVAGFQHNDFYMKVWLNNKGHCVMKQTDWQVMDEVPKAVWHTFTYGPYSTDEVLDVTFVEFPQKKPQIVIHLGEYNAETEYQLFYTTDGELINARNVTNMNNILGANTFL